MKQIVTSLLIGIATLLSVQVEAQTAEELKAQREQLQTELKSNETISREEKLTKLEEKAPSESGLQSIDGLAKTATGLLITVKSANDVLAKFKTDLKDSGNGEVDVTVHKAKLSDYIKLVTDLAAAAALIKTGMEQLKGAQADAKSLSPLKAKPALTSVSYSADALKLSGEEIAFQTKLVNNLIATINASGNY
ncbi:MAG: hypothetical protein FJY17_02390 [Bacteroidetes bacterium]|nr:hypothetical protein [Bacteroidota bacterium]MBM3886863.1 hypothetical protein [Candidatus Dependentiae bacterium]